MTRVLEEQVPHDSISATSWWATHQGSSAHALIAGLDASTGDASALVPLIEADRDIAGQLLALANTSLFGHRTRAANLWAAAMVVGGDVIRALACLGLMRPWSDPGLVSFSIDSATAAGIVARRASVRVDAAFAAALVHDVGAVEWSLTDADADGGDQAMPLPLAAERQVRGRTHDEAGFQILRELGFTPTLVEAAAYHNITPAHAPSTLSQVVIAGVGLAELCGFQPRTAPVARLEECLAALGLDHQLADDLERQQRHEAPALRALFRA